MARRTQVHDELPDDEYGDDSEATSDDWSEDDEEGATIDCPHCGREIYDAPRCPLCGQYVEDETTTPARKPWWIMLGTFACLYIVYQWLFGHLG